MTPTDHERSLAMADVPMFAAPAAPAPRVIHLRPLARALAELFPECKQHLPDVARVRIVHIEFLLLHVLGDPRSPDALPYPEGADYVGDNNGPHTYLARLFSELLDRDISAEVMMECVVTRPGQPWQVSGVLLPSLTQLCNAVAERVTAITQWRACVPRLYAMSCHWHNTVTSVALLIICIHPLACGDSAQSALICTLSGSPAWQLAINQQCQLLIGMALSTAYSLGADKHCVLPCS